MPSQSAIGSIETKGFPGILAAADAMVKAGRVTLVGYIRVGSARFTVNIRGDVSEVKTAMAAGIEAVKKSRRCYPRILGNYSPSSPKCMCGITH